MSAETLAGMLLLANKKEAGMEQLERRQLTEQDVVPELT